MATTDELLEQMENTENGQPALMIEVDHSTRTMLIPAALRVLGVQSDDSIKRLYFKMPTQYEECDLSTFIVRINYRNSKGDEDVYVVDDVTINEGNMFFTWLVGRNALSATGSVRFSLCLKYLEDGVVVQEYNTVPAILSVLEGLETTEAIVQEYPDILEYVLSRVQGVQEITIAANQATTNANNAAATATEAAAHIVRFDIAMDLTEDEKAQFRQNVGLGSSESVSSIDGVSPNSAGNIDFSGVRYAAQELSDGAKQQARINIDAVGSVDNVTPDDYGNVMLNAVSYNTQSEKTAAEQAQARQNMGAASAGDTIGRVYDTTAEALAAMTTEQLAALYTSGYRMIMATNDVDVVLYNLKSDGSKVDTRLAAYPVGSLYWSANLTSPAEIMGGTWTQIKDTFVLAAGDTYEAGSTGGEATHILTISEMPSHNHDYRRRRIFTDEAYSTEYKGYSDDSYSGHRVADTTYLTGGDQPHNNMPPYTTRYCWERVA